MSVTFKCNKTGNTVTFKSQYDIEAMRGHPEYTEVQSTSELLDNSKVLPENEQLTLQEQPKRGRPRKEHE